LKSEAAKVPFTILMSEFFLTYLAAD